MGELNELEYYIHLARRLDYMDEETEAQLEKLRAETARTLECIHFTCLTSISEHKP